jgi:hypothetical protein
MDEIRKPAHYQHASGIECKEITKDLPFVEGNIFKYIFRAGLKTGAYIDYAKSYEYTKMLPAALCFADKLYYFISLRKRHKIVGKINLLAENEANSIKKELFTSFAAYLLAGGKKKAVALMQLRLLLGRVLSNNN